MRSPLNRHRLPQLAADLGIVVAAWFFAFRLRFDTDLPVYYEKYVSWQILGLVAAIKLSIFALFGFYNRWWRYVSTRDMWGAARGVVAASLVTFLIFSFFDIHAADVPRTVWVIDGLLTLALVAGSRMLARTIIERPQSRSIVARGKEVFTASCAVCHVFDGQGGKVGPELTGINSRDRADILLEILDPNRSVEANYRLWNVTTKDGETFSGRLEAETQTSVEILDTTAQKHVVQRKNIASLEPSQLSIMPTGF